VAATDGGKAEQNLAKALTHPLRGEILQKLEGGPSSPKRISDALGEPLPNVAYHIRVLVDLGLLEPTKIRPARGAVEHFYRLVPNTGFGSQNWRRLPPAIRGEAAARALEGFITRAFAALEARVFQGRDGSAASWSPLTVDEAGWSELMEIVAEVEMRFQQVGERSANRLDDPMAGFSAVVFVSVFEAADQHQGGQDR
jgi:DNA-binding transcriptional ArsR family regulator